MENTGRSIEDTVPKYADTGSQGPSIFDFRRLLVTKLM